MPTSIVTVTAVADNAPQVQRQATINVAAKVPLAIAVEIPPGTPVVDSISRPTATIQQTAGALTTVRVRIGNLSPTDAALGVQVAAQLTPGTLVDGFGPADIPAAQEREVAFQVIAPPAGQTLRLNVLAVALNANSVGVEIIIASVAVPPAQTSLVISLNIVAVNDVAITPATSVTVVPTDKVTFEWLLEVPVNLPPAINVEVEARRDGTPIGRWTFPEIPTPAEARPHRRFTILAGGGMGQVEVIAGASPNGHYPLTVTGSDWLGIGAILGVLAFAASRQQASRRK